MDYNSAFSHIRPVNFSYRFFNFNYVYRVTFYTTWGSYRDLVSTYRCAIRFYTNIEEVVDHSFYRNLSFH